MNSSKPSKAQRAGQLPMIVFLVLSGIAGYSFFAFHAIPSQEDYLKKNQEELFSEHFKGLNEALDGYISRGLTNQERKYLAENWTSDTRQVGDIEYKNPTHFANEVAKLQQRDFYLNLLKDEEALVKKEAAKLKQSVQEGASAWSGPYGVELKTEFGMDTRSKYLAILRYGTERISPLFELDPTISYYSPRYRADRSNAIRSYYIKQTLIFLPAVIGIYFLVRFIANRFERKL